LGCRCRSNLECGNHKRINTRNTWIAIFLVLVLIPFLDIQEEIGKRTTENENEHKGNLCEEGTLAQSWSEKSVTLTRQIKKNSPVGTIIEHERE